MYGDENKENITIVSESPKELENIQLKKDEKLKEQGNELNIYEQKSEESKKVEIINHIIKSIKWDKINKGFKTMVYENIDNFEKDDDWTQFKMPKIVDKFKSS